MGEAFDWLCDGPPLLLEWLALRQGRTLLRLGLWSGLECLRRGTAPAEAEPPGDEERLLLHVLAALCAGRPEPLRRYADSLEDEAGGGLPELGRDLGRWLAWSRLPATEAFQLLDEELPEAEEAAPLKGFVGGWLLLARPEQAAARFRLVRRQAGRLGRGPLAELAARALEWAQAAEAPRPRVAGVREPEEGATLAARLERRRKEGTAARDERARRREGCYLSCHRYGRMVGAAPAFLDLVRRLEGAARDSLPLLLFGETGTGKELAVEYLHRLAYPAGAPLVAVNCGGLTEALAEAELFGSARGAFTGAVEREGLVAQAEGGLLFLDEFGALPRSVQARLLRFLESGVFRRVGEARERSVRVRVAAATCERERLAGSFRQDLLHRVAGRVIEVPPLAARLEDLPLLARAFLHEAGVADPIRHPACAPEALARLARAAWPGNIRQLRHLFQRLAPLPADEVAAELADLPPAGAPPPTRAAPALLELEALPLREALACIEWRLIQGALARCGNDKRAAAKQLGISIPTLYSRLKGAAGRP